MARMSEKLYIGICLVGLLHKYRGVLLHLLPSEKITGGNFTPVKTVQFSFTLSKTRFEDTSQAVLRLLKPLSPWVTP